MKHTHTSESQIGVVSVVKYQRCLASHIDFSAGKTILRCKPYAAVLLKELREKRCARCFEELGSTTTQSSVPCSHHCQSIVYCSRRCCSEDSAAHWVECALTRKVGLQAVIPTVALVLRVLHRLTIDPSEYIKIEGLLDHNSLRSKEEMKSFTMMGMNIWDAFLHLKDPQCTGVSLPDCLNATFVVKLLGTISCNAFSISDGEMQPIGRGLYLDAVYANHSCQPNCVAIFQGNLLCLRSCVSISKGQELTISYIDLAKPTFQRRKELKEGYFFNCLCQRCTSAQAVDQDRQMAGYLCPRSGCKALCTVQSSGPAVFRHWQLMNLSCLSELSAHDLSSPQISMLCCDTCGLRTNARRSVEKKIEIQKMMEKAEIQARKPGNLHGTINTYKLALSKAQEFQHSTSLECMDCYNALIKCCLQEQNFKAASYYCEQSLNGYNANHPPGSPMPGLQYFLLGKLLWYLDDSNGAGRHLRRALDILSITHGADHPLVQSILKIQYDVENMKK